MPHESPTVLHAFRLPRPVARALRMRVAAAHTTQTAVVVQALRAHLGPELAEIDVQSDQLTMEEESKARIA
jgi:hypothetical protein